MRITACAATAILLAGCSWSGGNNQSQGYGYSQYGQGQYQTAGLRGSNYGYGMQQAAYNPCAPQVYAVQTTSVECTTGATSAAYGGSYGSGTGYAGQTAQSAYGAYGSGTGYTGTTSNYGSYGSGTGYTGQSAAYGGSYGSGTGYTGGYTTGCQAGTAGCASGYGYGYGQQAQAGYYPVRSLRPRASYGAAAPFGLEFGIGTEFDVAGNFKRNLTQKAPGLVDPDLTMAVDDVEFSEVYDPAARYQFGATYALDNQTLLLGQLGYSKAESNQVSLGVLDDGTINETLYADASDLEQLTVEGGLRRYFGGIRPGYGASAIVPYVGGTIGGTYLVDDVVVTQSSATRYADNTGTGGTDDRLVDTLYQSGWSPTASAVVGAEWRVGRMVGLGVETGIRYTGALDGVTDSSDDRWTVPLTLRGRLAF